MENLKIKVSNEAESREAQELWLSLTGRLFAYRNLNVTEPIHLLFSINSVGGWSIPQDVHQLIVINEYEAMFNSRTLWIENVPYAAFRLNEHRKSNVSPSRYTKYLLNKRLKVLTLEREKQKAKQRAMEIEQGGQK